VIMNRILYVLSAFLLLSLGLAGCQPSSEAQKGFPGYQTTELMGHTVMDREGVQLGQISDLVLDCNGQIDFALVNQLGSDPFPARLVVVPFRALTISKGESNEIRVVFSVEKEKFYEGPEWGHENLADVRGVYSVYRYYGIQPSWSDRPLRPCY
jgi:sporulation protein YlmC with PRC-barrel domain